MRSTLTFLTFLRVSRLFLGRATLTSPLRVTNPPTILVNKLGPMPEKHLIRPHLSGVVSPLNVVTLDTAPGDRPVPVIYRLNLV